jgi:hypothetical protein
VGVPVVGVAGDKADVFCRNSRRLKGAHRPGSVSVVRIQSTEAPFFMALPRHTPSASFCNADTFEYPFDSMRDFAWPSVKLLAPGTGAFGFAVVGDVTDGVVDV